MRCYPTHLAMMLRDGWGTWRVCDIGILETDPRRKNALALGTRLWWDAKKLLEC